MGRVPHSRLDNAVPACYTYPIAGRRKRKAVRIRREPVAVFGSCKPCIRRGYRLPLHFVWEGGL